MDLHDLRTLLDYHYWARDRVLDAVEPLSPEHYTRNMGSSFASVRDTLAHVHAAEWAWHERWNGRLPPAPRPLDEFADVAGLRAAWADTETQLRGFLERVGAEPGGLNRVIEYRLFSGEPGASVFWHMLQHVVNHASYHRGQVTTMLRQLGARPGKPMDLIAYYRTRR
jgi:uncharacterized damage-inducible protein DinB